MQKEPGPHDSLSEAADFILSFIQALLKTGYYTPGHPETQKAREGLYAEFNKVLKGYKEVTFVSATEKDKRDVMIDGMFDEPTRLSKILLKGMTEMFIPKFLEYFERKHLTSFSIKSQITKEEFENFINIMSESPYEKETSDSHRERMALELIKNHIVSVSTVFNVDLVGAQRKLPWRVDLALTRLKTDLGKIPLYKNLSAEQITEIKAMVFDDIIRPVKVPVLVKDILANLDLILFDTMGISREELEDEVTKYINKDCLLLAASELLNEYLKLKEAYQQFKEDKNILKHLESVRAITKKVARQIASYEVPDDTLLLEFVEHELLSVDDLPGKTRNKARRVKTVDNFLQNTEEYYNIFKKTHKDEIQQKCRMFVDLLPELLSRSCFIEIDNIIRMVKKTGFSFSAMGETFFDEISEQIHTLEKNSSKEDQIKIMDILDSFGSGSVPVLIDMLVAESRLVRKIACDMLIARGADAVQHIVANIDKRNHWHYTRNFLMILAEIGQGGQEIEGIFEKFITHEEQRVREEVIKGITNMMGIKAEGLLLGFLKDPSPSVRRKAIWGLGMIKSTGAEVISYLDDVLQGKIEEDEPTIEQAFLTLAVLGPHIKNCEDLEDTIIKILKGKSLMGKLTGKIVLNDRLKTKACGVLGAFGTKKSINILKKFQKDKNQELKDEAGKAVEKISSRI